MDVVISVLLYVVVFFLGASIGSFSLVVIRRGHSGENGSWAKGKSVCESCKKDLKWWELIPTFSFLFLGGKCSKCKSKIDPSHFFCETAVGIAYTFLFSLFASGRIDAIQLILMFGSHAVLIALSFNDILYRTIDVIPVYVLGGTAVLYNSITTERYYLILVVAGLFALFGFLCSKDNFVSFGSGDIDVLICLFALTASGFAIFDILIYAALLGIVLSFTVLRKSDKHVPFVPCLYFGYVLYSCGISISQLVYELTTQIMHM